jgi:hypothetical protein
MIKRNVVLKALGARMKKDARLVWLDQVPPNVSQGSVGDGGRHRDV